MFSPNSISETDELIDSNNDLMGPITTIKSRALDNVQTNKLAEVINAIPEIIAQLNDPEYDEIYGYRINIDCKEFVNVIVRNEILLRFLMANAFDVEETKIHLIDTLNWRHSFKPLSAAYLEKYSGIEDLTEFTKLAYFRDNEVAQPNLKVGLWDLHCSLGDSEKFFIKYGLNSENKVDQTTQLVRWHVGLREKAIKLLDFTDPQNDKMFLVSDYEGIPLYVVNTTSSYVMKELGTIYSKFYPELVSTKFNINVQTSMSWVYRFCHKIGFADRETAQHLHVLNNGDLSPWLYSEYLPRDYGGRLNDLEHSLEFVEEETKKFLKITQYGEIIIGIFR